MADLDTRFRALDRVTAPDVWDDARTRSPRRPEPPPRGRLVAAGLALLVGGAGIAAAATSFLGGSTAPNPTGTRVVNGRIAYVLADDRTGNYDIYSVNPDGSDPVRLTDDPREDTDPSWSPDGRRIVFNDRPLIEGQPWDISVMSADGTDRRVLVHDGLLASWSPDASRIVFVRAGDTGDMDIFTANADGSDVTQLTADPAREVSPTWSPDGTRIAFVKDVESPGNGAGDLYVMNADGSGERRVPSPVPVGDPRWSPDGTSFVFDSAGEGRYDVYVMDSDGSGLVNLTDDSARDLSPTWSPDGTQIAFSSDRDGTRQIYVMNADGTGVRQVTHGPITGAFPSWGPAAQPSPGPP